jgi:cytochrome c oxidase cbb3-type subunit 4
MSTLLSLWTVVVLIVFIGIVFWAWNGSNTTRFDAAARIPLDDDNGADIPEAGHND